MQQPYQQQGARPFNQSGFQQPYAPRQPYQPPGFQQNQGGVGQSSNEKSELEELRLMCKSQAVSIKTLENQIGQIANALLIRPQGTLPSDTEANPGKREVKEQVKAVTLRSGKATVQPKPAVEQEIEISGSEASTPALSTGAPAPLSGEEIKKSSKGEEVVIVGKKGDVPIGISVPKQKEVEKQVYPPPPFP